jgi:hypothetical protein
MKLKTILTVVYSILFVSLSFSQNFERESKTFKVNPGGKLTISLSVGDIHLKSGSGNEIKVQYDREDGNDFDINQSGNNIDISSSSGSWGNDLYVMLPSNFNISARTMGGDIKLEGGLKGKLECSTSGGDIITGDVIGNAKLQTSGGDISTGEINGDADVVTSGGDIKLGKISGKASISTSGGNITMSSIGNSAEIMTGGGNVSVNSIGGDTKIKTGGGNITSGKISGNAILKTGGGNISLDGASGNIQAESGAGTINIEETGNKFTVLTGSGDIFVKISSNINGDCLLKSGNGNITLSVPPNAKLTINAEVKSVGWWGSEESGISSDFPAANADGSKHTNRQTFEINGGGSKIDIYSGMGSIDIKKAK